MVLKLLLQQVIWHIPVKSKTKATEQRTLTDVKCQSQTKQLQQQQQQEQHSQT